MNSGIHYSTRGGTKTHPSGGKIKVLFIGLAESTHTHAWIDLLEGSQIDRRLYALPSGLPPESWAVKTYIPRLLHTRNSNTREYLYARFFLRLKHVFSNTSQAKSGLEKHRLEKSALYLLAPLLLRFSRWLPMERFLRSLEVDRFGAEIWLAHIIKSWKPDIIHTLGLFDNQGGMFYYAVRKKFRLEGQGIWVLQLRGGSDMTLRRHDPEFIDVIRQVLMECDQIITDNLANLDYADELGIGKEKFASIVPVPGTGGIALDDQAAEPRVPPSQRERMILWPKAYESVWSKGMPVFEGLRLAWDQIRPCEVYFLAVDHELKSWSLTLQPEIRDHFHLVETRVPRRQLISYARRARVLLSPSLIDGVPNVLYEAMAYGAFPIVSPLDTLKPVVKHEENVLFARNLYPEEICNALIRAMSDDALVDSAARNNINLVRRIANRDDISRKVIQYYVGLLGNNNARA